MTTLAEIVMTTLAEIVMITFGFAATIASAFFGYPDGD